MDCFVCVSYGGSVTKEDCLFKGMVDDLEMFDEPPSFNDLVLRLKGKFRGDFTLHGRFYIGVNRTRYVIMPLCD